MVQPSAPSPKRRRLLGAVATGATAATAGCMRRLRSITGWQSRSQLSLQIRAVPADADPYAFRIARRLAEWFGQAGLDVSIEPLSEEQLLRSVLLDHDFELFVGQLTPTVRDPDGLYPLLHSRFVDAPGWQNPFGYADLAVDESLETQRRTENGRRREAVSSLQETIVRAQPFTTLAFPQDVRAARSDRFENWNAGLLDSPLGYLRLTPADESDADTLRAVVTDERATENLNPLSVEFRRNGFVMRLLYDALGRVTPDGSVTPWLAENWTFSVDGADATATVTLREDLRWHDGEPLTAADVAFTFSLLQDTRGVESEDGEDPDEGPVPAPRFRGESSLVESVRATDDRTVVFEFADSARSVATSALTVPVLPEHVWAGRRNQASVSGIQLGPATEALVTDNVPPVGSGPVEFVRNNPGESLVLERYDDHFLRRDDVRGVPERARGGPAFERLRFQVVGSDTSAVELVADGDADVTQTPVGAATVPRIGRADDAGLLVSRSDDPYVVGFNVRNPPLSNSRFRNTLAHLVDQAALVDDVFDGYAEPVASPLAGTEWLPESLEWNGEHPTTPFVGTDGDLDVERARDAFRDAGFLYDDGKLLQND